MSAAEAAADERCASCGIAAGNDDIKLKKCGACGLVRYCSLQCQRNHRPQHKRACKKRAAELHDELLFKQPESTHLGDCPICMLPLPLPSQNSVIQSCCFKRICVGCVDANEKREMEARLIEKCPFCRTPVPSTETECEINKMKRVKANDPAALTEVGLRRYKAGDYAAAVEYWEKAARLGDIQSCYYLSDAYKEGQGVEQDTKKYIHYTEQAAIGGHVGARHKLGIDEMIKGNFDRGVKHYIIAANLGFDLSLQALREHYALLVVRKEDFAAALRAHQAAVDAMKSPQRDAAKLARTKNRS